MKKMEHMQGGVKDTGRKVRKVAEANYSKGLYSKSSKENMDKCIRNPSDGILNPNYRRNQSNKKPYNQHSYDPVLIKRSETKIPKLVTINKNMNEFSINSEDSFRIATNSPENILTLNDQQDTNDVQISEGQVQFIQEIGFNSKEQLDYLSNDFVNGNYIEFTNDLSLFDEISYLETEKSKEALVTNDNSLESSKTMLSKKNFERFKSNEPSHRKVIRSGSSEHIKAEFFSNLPKEKLIDNKSLMNVPTVNLFEGTALSSSIMQDQEKSILSRKNGKIDNVISSSKNEVGSKKKQKQSVKLMPNYIGNNIAEEENMENICQYSQQNEQTDSPETADNLDSTALPENYLHMSPRIRSSSRQSLQHQQAVHPSTFSQNHQGRSMEDISNIQENYTQSELPFKIPFKETQSRLPDNMLQQLVMLLNTLKKLNEKETSDGSFTIDDWKIKVLQDMIREIQLKEKDCNIENVHKFHSTPLKTDNVQKLKDDVKRLKYLNGILIKENESYKKQLLKLEDQMKDEYSPPDEKLMTMFPGRSSCDDIILPAKNSISYNKWHNLKEQAELVVKENRFLMEQKHLQKETIEELANGYQEEIKELSHKLGQHIKEKTNMEHQIFQNQFLYKQLQTQHEILRKELKSSIEYSKHEEKINEIEKLFKSEIVKLRKEIENLKCKVKSSAKERECLAIKVINLNVENDSLRLELKERDRSVRKYERKLLESYHQLENKTSKAGTATKTLNKIILLAERDFQEKEILEYQLYKQKFKAAIAMSHLTDDEKKLKMMNELLNHYKNENSGKLAVFENELKNKDEMMKDIKRSYLKDLSELKDLVGKKETYIEEFRKKNLLTEKEIKELCTRIK